MNNEQKRKRKTQLIISGIFFVLAIAVIIFGPYVMRSINCHYGEFGGSDCAYTAIGTIIAPTLLLSAGSCAVSIIFLILAIRNSTKK